MAIKQGQGLISEGVLTEFNTTLIALLPPFSLALEPG